MGHGVNGSKNYLVAYPQGEIIEVNEEGGKELRGFYVTNEAWAVDAILNGDGMTPGAFTTGDYLLLKVIGNHPDGTSDTISVYLADYRSENEAEHYYLKDWTWVDLSSMGKVESLTFRMESSRKNNWGMTTPVDVNDVMLLVEYVLTNKSEGIDLDVADINGDGEITVNDVSGIVAIILGN